MNNQNSICESFQPMISAQLDGELSGNEQTELQTHLETCFHCRQQLTAFTLVDEAVDGLSTDPPLSIPSLPSQLTTTTNGQLVSKKTQLGKSRPATSVWRLIPLAVAATVLVCLFIAMLPNPNPVTAEQVSPEQIVRPLKELHLINLQQQHEQELMLRALAMDLRSLKLEIAQLESGATEQDALVAQVNSMIEKIRRFEQHPVPDIPGESSDTHR